MTEYLLVMIVRRIYAVAKGSEGSASIRQLKFVMRILIESGFLYLSVTIPHFVSWWTPNAYAIDVISAIVSLLSLQPLRLRTKVISLERIHDGDCI